ncbi:hypothetical protein H6G04_11885 [Calothrix membranacea FACHB-236]|nr:hypothetical protein [Calothrix membranacea FACHB-236]
MRLAFDLTYRQADCERRRETVLNNTIFTTLLVERAYCFILVVILRRLGDEGDEGDEEDEGGQGEITITYYPLPITPCPI